MFDLINKYISKRKTMKYVGAWPDPPEGCEHKNYKVLDAEPLTQMATEEFGKLVNKTFNQAGLEQVCALFYHSVDISFSTMATCIKKLKGCGLFTADGKDIELEIGYFICLDCETVIDLKKLVRGELNIMISSYYERDILDYRDVQRAQKLLENYKYKNRQPNLIDDNAPRDCYCGPTVSG